MSGYADITPHVHYIRSLRASGPPDYIQLTGEAVDNCFDAGATRVEITISEETIRFRDNGHGIEKKNELALFRLGEHVQLSSMTQNLGRYGAGIKLQALRAGDCLDVLSKSQDGKMTGGVNWRELTNSKHGWRIDWPVWSPAAITTPTGCDVTVSHLLRTPTYNEERLHKELALRFFPALADGREIVLNGRSVAALPDPKLTDPIHAHLSFDGNRHAEITAGILVAADSPLKLVHVSFLHRTLMPEKRFGVGAYSGVARLYARVHLTGRWTLGVFKDQLNNAAETAELEDAVEETLRPLLEKCHGSRIEANLLNLRTELNEMLPEDVAAARPKRRSSSTTASKEKSKSNHGRVSPEKAVVSSSGPARVKASPAKLIIDFEKAGADTIGHFDGVGRIHRIILSIQNPTIADFIKQRERHRSAARGLYVMAIQHYVHETTGRQLHFNLPDFDNLDYGSKVALLLEAQEELVQMVAEE